MPSLLYPFSAIYCKRCNPVRTTEIDYNKWKERWQESGAFAFRRGDKSSPILSIDTPPPFTSGDLHIGQAYWVIYTDSIARYYRMKGYNVLYPVGWDMQGFPIELQAEKRFGREMPREEFYRRCSEIAVHNMGLMKAQMSKLGASFDVSLEYMTMSPEYRRKVQLSLLLMHEKGFVYRGKHPVEWCTHCNSSIAREETSDVERNSQSNYIKFACDGGHIEIATTRPELLHACVAVAVNPGDERYKSMVGKGVAVPLAGRKVKVIADELVDASFGTGAEMVCTFGDKNDVIMFYKHGLHLVGAMSGQGLLTNSGKYDGMNSKDARAAVLRDLREAGLLLKQEQVAQTVKVHDRCNTPIELLVSTQWFIRTKEHAEKIKEVASGVRFIPERKLQELCNWANYIEWDWSISRNRVFGTPLPFWYCGDCGTIIPARRESLPVDPASSAAPRRECPKCGSSKVIAERNTCDVWVDSSITPMVIAGWPDDMELFKRAFPATFRIQGNDIIRTWAFYTILRTWALTGNKPFESLIVNGMVLGEDGREMHKSWGNGVLPEDVLRDYGVDAMRLWAAMSGSVGKDKPFSYVELNHSRAFSVKLYNSALFIRGALASVREPKHAEKHMGVFDIWILIRLNSLIREVEEAYERFDLYAAMSALTNFYWHEFCDYYLEDVKYRVSGEGSAGQASRESAAFTLKHVLLTALKLIAPVMPFLAEETNAMFESGSVFAGELPVHKEMPAGKYVVNGVLFAAPIQVDYESAGALLNGIVSDVRKAKSSARLALNKGISAININVREEYLGIIEQSKGELAGILKAGSVNVKPSQDYSVSIEA